MLTKTPNLNCPPSGFTLIELIVVITILAILATLGFISLQGYTSQSRDAKRVSDVRTIGTAVNLASTRGTSLISTVTPVSGNPYLLPSPSIAGKASTPGIDYQSGITNFTITGLNGSSFKDPSTGGDYPLAVTTRNGGGFQISARLE